MTETEISLNNWIQDVCNHLKQKYGQPELKDKFGKEWYRVKEGYHIHPDLLGSIGGMVIEHARDPMTVYAAEDGDIFYFEDYTSVEEMIRRIENEIISYGE